MDDYTRLEIEAATFRRLVDHLDAHKDVQNIDLMNLASFCRNCLSKWYRAEAAERGVELDYERAREAVYGMPYAEWKERYQTEATQVQLDRLKGGTEA
ncbi:MAG: deoxycytidine triphosphate deaminase [Gammaproteobacteria bacterium]|mgnify:FL=1|nr:deoxycytidine triphosphate deaminase [Gammaproteobacteria bacterium]|tara:strand:- start:342 stop:635 length:294 start_codon:yes stop_codon:yes gene_type:complete